MLSRFPVTPRLVVRIALGLALSCAGFARSADAAQRIADSHGTDDIPYLAMQPADYGRSGFRPDSESSPTGMWRLTQFPDTIQASELKSLRGDVAATSGVRTVAYVETGYVEAGGGENSGESPSRQQEEIDNRQPLLITANLDEALKDLSEAASRLEASLGPDKSEEWTKRLQAVRDIIAAIQSKWSEAQAIEAKVKSIPQELAALQQVLSQPQPSIESTGAPATAAEGQSRLDAAKQTLQLQKQEFEQYQGLINGRAQQKADFEGEVAVARKQLDEFNPAAPPGDETPESSMRQLENRVQLLALRTQLLYGEQRSKLHAASDEWTRLKRDASQLQVAGQQAIVEELERQVNELRRMEIKQQAEQAQRDAAKVDTNARSLALIAENNSKLVRDRDELTRKVEGATLEKNKLSEVLDQVKEKRGRLESKVAVAGMNHAVGLLMREHRRELPSISEAARRIKQIERELPDIQLLKINLEDSRDRIVDVSSVIQAQLRELAENDNVVITPKLESAVTELVNTRRQLIWDLIQDFDHYIDQLSQIDSLSHQLIAETRTSQYFVDKHVLWIRSTEPLNRADLGKTLSALLEVTRTLQPEVANFDARVATRRWSQFAVWAVLILLVGVFTRKRLKRTLAATSEQVSRSASRRLTVVLQMLALMLSVAAFWPAVLWGIGQYLSNDAFDPGSTAGSIGQALLAVVPFVALASAMWQVTLRDGFAEKYLAWPAPAISAIHRSIRWYLYSVLPWRGAGVFFDHFPNGDWAASAGRSMFILSQITLFVCLNIAIRQVSSALLSISQPRERTFWLRTRQIWCTAIVLAPLTLAGLSLIGYHYSASELSSRFGWTVWLIVAAAAFVSLAQQIVQIVLQSMSLRRFWLDRAREATHPTGEPEEDFDAEKVNHQIGRLLRGFTFAGVVLSMFLIWSQVLPAIQVLDQVELWSVKIDVAENVVGKDGLPQSNTDGSILTRTVSKMQKITLADLAWATICLVLTLILSRNLPGLLEVTLLDRLPLDRGGKYAVSVVCRYVVAIAGAVMAARCLGFEWSSVQWLVAAMSVGLGFGLQEIFGNFVSGMIILLERPIRVGDLVTVNGTTGCVTRIQLRATTITDADRREMIVPNKKFITDDVVNWTLTDPITRVVIPIGIAYGSNTELACETLLDVARRHPHVMRDPEPNAVFTRFGASSLELELRVYIATREHFPDVQHELHLAIDRAFREKKIEIAYPQQDIHIREPDAMAKALLQARQEIKQQGRGQSAA